MALITTGANAATVSTAFTIGTVDAVSSDTSVFDFTQFSLGEHVKLELTLDDATPDVVGSATKAIYSDATATMKLVGASSGTELSLADGVRIRADSVANTMSIDSILSSPTAAAPIIFKNAIDYVFSGAVFTDVNSLSAILADVALESGQRDRHSINFFVSSTGGEAAGMWIAAVPLPAAGLGLLSGLGLLGLQRRRKQLQAA